MKYKDHDHVERVLSHPWHDCAYVRQRNLLIPGALKAAMIRDLVGKGTHFSPARFMDEMNARWAAVRAAGKKPA